MVSALYYVSLIVGKMPAFCLCLKASAAVSSRSVAVTSQVHKMRSVGENHSYLIKAADPTMQLVL